jgi:hypothetical protein
VALRVFSPGFPVRRGDGEPVCLATDVPKERKSGFTIPGQRNDVEIAMILCQGQINLMASLRKEATPAAMILDV